MTMQKLLYLFLIINLSFWVHSCVDSVPFPTKSEEGFLSVEGTFHNLADTQFVNLYRSKGYNATPNPEINARITVFSNDNKSAIYDEIRPGVYALLPQILRGEVGKRYFIEIKTSDGKTYQSEPDTMPEPVKPDSISFSAYDKSELSPSGFETKDRVLKILINTPIKQGNMDAFLRWNIDDSFEFNTLPECNPSFKNVITCYYSRKMPNSRLALASSKDLLYQRVDDFAINEVSLRLFSLQFKEIHYWRVNQNAITEKAYSYWKNIDKVSNQVGSLFDVAPAYVKGNLFNVTDKEEKVLGYFEIAAVERIVRPLTIGLINRDYGFVQAKEYDPCDDYYTPEKRPLCCNCPIYQIIGWTNTPQKPSYWK
jgi:Domain of unknown function (DUF4249)